MRQLTQLTSALNNGEFDGQLARMYPREADGLEVQRRRIAALIDRFSQFAPGTDSAGIFSAPGRTEIGGNHTDHQNGCVLAAAVDMDAIAVAAPNGTMTARIASEGYEPFEVDLARLEVVEAEASSPTALVRGIAAAVSALGCEPGGFTACVTSNVPKGSGLSSSACVEILFGTIFNFLFCGGRLRPMELARAGQFAENNYAMKPSGLLDQAAASVGGLVSMDFSRKDDPVLERLEFDFEAHGYTLCVVNTGGDHSDLTRDYAAIPREMRSVARCFGRKVLGEVDEGEFMADIPRVRAKLGDRAVLRAMHFFEETKRAIAQADCLRAGDIDGFLRLVNESGRSSDLLLQNAWSPRRVRQQAIPLGEELARRALGGRGAYRLQGGGFAGTVQAYCPNERYDGFRAVMEKVFGVGSCRRLGIRSVGGVAVVD